MKKIIVFILLSLPGVLFAQNDDMATSLKGAFVVYAFDSTTKTPLDSVWTRFYNDNNELVAQGYTKVSGYDTVSVPFGNYKIVIEQKRYHARTRYINFEHNPNYKDNYFALICPLAKYGIKLNLDKP